MSERDNEIMRCVIKTQKSIHWPSTLTLMNFAMVNHTA